MNVSNINNFEPVQFIQLESIEILDSTSTEITHENASKMIQNLTFKCTICPLQFDDKQGLHSHIRDHFNSIICMQCNKTLIGDKQYDYHLKHAHSVKRTIPAKTNNASKPQTASKRNRSAPENIRADLEDLNGAALETVDSSTLNEPTEYRKMSRISCDVCGRLFQNTAAVRRHKQTHSIEGKKFICGICGSGFNKKTNLEFHLRIHTNERPFNCDQCSKSFAHASGLSCHRRVHSGERPYKCPFFMCQKSYSHSTDLRRHRRTHGLEEKRFTCNFCEKQFYENKFLRSHMRSHHRDRSNDIERSKTIKTGQIEVSHDDSATDEYIDYEYIQSD